jgi:hypothetical protein
MHQAIIGLVHDLVDRKWRGWTVWILISPLTQFRGDFVEPFFKYMGRACVKRRERTHDASLTLSNDQIRVGNDEKRSPDHRDAKAR